MRKKRKRKYIEIHLLVKKNRGSENLSEKKEVDRNLKLERKAWAEKTFYLSLQEIKRINKFTGIRNK